MEHFYETEDNIYILNTKKGPYKFKTTFVVEENAVMVKVSFFVFSVESWLTCLDVFITDFIS